MAAPEHTETDFHPRGRFVNGDFIGRRRLECNTTVVNAMLAYFDTPPNDLWPAAYNYGGHAGDALITEADVYPKPGSKVTTSTRPYAGYEKTIIDLTYSTRPMFNVGGYRVWEELDPGVRRVSVSRSSGLLWASDDKPLRAGDNVTAYATGGTYQIHHFKLLTAPQAIFTVWGKTNSAAYTTASLGYTFPVDTMLCIGAHVERGSPGSLTSSWKQAKYKFGIHLDGWNKVWRSQTATFEAVKLPTGETFYPQPRVFFNYVTLRT